MIGWLRTALFFTGWLAATALLGFLALPALLSRRACWALARLWAAGTLRWLCLTCGIHTEIRGQAHRPHAASLVASKHQSAWDTLVLWCQLRNPAFVLKRELYFIPVFGWYLWRTGQIAIDRRAGREAMQQILAQAAPVLAQGRSIVIFPEGTRVPPGELRPFRSGIARLSAALQWPVTPVALNAGRFWPKHSLRKSPGRAVLEFMPPMPPCADQAPWLAELQARINDRSEQLYA